jgi:hypothetical protein
LSSASLKSCLLRFGGLPEGTGVFSTMPPNGISYEHLDCRSTDGEGYRPKKVVHWQLQSLCHAAGQKQYYWRVADMVCDDE